MAASGPRIMERFVIIVNGWKPLTIITKRSVLDVAAVLDPPLECARTFNIFRKYLSFLKEQYEMGIKEIRQIKVFYYTNWLQKLIFRTFFSASKDSKI